MRFGVVTFPGSNDDDDAVHALSGVLGQDVRRIWHKEPSLGGLDCVVLPGGFSYGDCLGCGAVAKMSPVMESVVRFARSGGLVLGICNGFQILCEAGLLPGALVRNRSLVFVYEHVRLRVECANTPFTGRADQGQLLSIPIKHGEGCYYADEETLKSIEEKGRILLRYVDERGEPTAGANPNGSLAGVAGVCNEEKNVFGLMPHPEHACEEILGSVDGRVIFESLVDHWEGHGS